MNKKFNKLSVCIVAYNEDLVIERCLESIKNIADEIIIVLDGKSTDKTEQICRKYTDKIFKKRHCGFSESHLAFAFQKAESDWVLKIDADEFLLPQYASVVGSLMENEDIDGYFFLWRLWNGQEYITKNKPYKPVLFRRSKMFFLGVTHGIMQTYGKTKNARISLEHQPLYNNWCYDNFKSKQLKRAKVHAKCLLKHFCDIPKFNYNYYNYPFPIRIRKRLFFLFPLFAIYKAIVNFIKGEKSIVAAKVSLWTGLYEFYLGYFMCLEKIKLLFNLNKF